MREVMAHALGCGKKSINLWWPNAVRGRETQNQVSKVNCYSTFLYVSVLCDKLCPIEQISSSSENIVQQFLIQLISKVNCYFFIFPDKSTALGTSCTDPNLFLAPIERDGDCLDLRVVVPPVLVEPAVDAQLHVVGQPVHAEPAAIAELLAAGRASVNLFNLFVVLPQQILFHVVFC